MRLQPDQLAQLITKNNLSEFEAQMSLGDERARKVLENLRLTLDPLNLETTAIDDRIFIELNLSTGSVSNYKDASELSRGQKCTALLPLLLARRDSPLVIDQPEDNLDNHFIYETVVENIRRMKVRRQMVFITHNANIPVLAEADLVVVLNSDGKIGYIEKAGTLDECREEIIDLLEGGREAFELRSRRYGKS
jgi:energy-coupling factor transporter ATP-binding protein EcfA2